MFDRPTPFSTHSPFSGLHFRGATTSPCQLFFRSVRFPSNWRSLFPSRPPRLVPLLSVCPSFFHGSLSLKIFLKRRTLGGWWAPPLSHSCSYPRDCPVRNFRFSLFLSWAPLKALLQRILATRPVCASPSSLSFISLFFCRIARDAPRALSPFLLGNSGYLKFFSSFHFGVFYAILPPLPGASLSPSLFLFSRFASVLPLFHWTKPPNFDGMDMT